MGDIEIYSSGSGGEFRLDGSRIKTTSSLFNQVFLALFGGNVEESTQSSYAPGEQRKDWWGNSVLLSENPDNQFNSKTERVLRSVVLNSSGRINIEEAAKEDTRFLKELGEVSVSVIFDSDNRVQIVVRIDEPTEKKSQQFNYIWDSSKGEVIDSFII